jgi:hypothetical protein
VNELDEIMSGSGEAMPAIEQEQITQPRDDSGRFAPKADEAPVQAAAVIEEQPLGQEEAHEQGGIPPQRLKAEADKRREAEASAEALRREIAELRGMVQARQQPTPQPQQEQQPASLWDDPDAYLKGQLTPVQHEVSQVRTMFMRFEAIQSLGEGGAEKVQAALDAAKMFEGTPQEKVLEAQIMGSGNPFSNLVKWHQQQQVMSRIGNDPDAWLHAEMEKRLSDPAEQAKILERIRTGAASNTSRSQPITNLPPSLSRLPSGGNQAADNDMSDGALFSHATR